MRGGKAFEIAERFFPGEKWRQVRERLVKIKEKYKFPARRGDLSHGDCVLITYGDNFRLGSEKPLKTLLKFLTEYAGGLISCVHALPFYPYSSDDGFAVTNYKEVDRKLGNWGHIRRISKKFDLMFDFVLNHVSTGSAWFEKYLNSKGKFSEYFLEAGEKWDVSKVVRPRSSPLLTEFRKKNGESVKVWTTFSEDQADLNFSSSEVFLAMTDVFLFYLSKGARIIRLDAIAYLWKETGTGCLHLEKTHLYVKFLRALAKSVAPGALIITETNVPHKENISYFGRGDETHMVYQFPLPPLLAHALITETIAHFRKWLKDLPDLRKNEYFFNFTASHDGVGVLPLSGLLPESETRLMEKTALERGGFVSHKKNPDGSESPYELNVSYVNLINPPGTASGEKAARFMVSQFVALSLKGIPGIYVHSLIGSENYPEGVKKTGRKRSINREKLNFEKFKKEISDEKSLRFKIYSKYSALLKARKREKAFHPEGKQKVMDYGNKIFALMRSYCSSRVLCLANISPRPQKIKKPPGFKGGKDIISGKKINPENFSLGPFETLWIKPGKTFKSS